MPEDGSKLVNVDVLADAGAQVGLELPVAGFDRLGSALGAMTGIASAQVGFRREQGHVVAAVQARAELVMVCQRCLSPFTVTVEGGTDVVLVGTEAEAARVPEEFETVLCPQGKIRLRELVEEELLLALPAVPMHPQGECGAAPAGEISPPAAAPTQRPFAMLGEMLDSDHGN